MNTFMKSYSNSQRPRAIVCLSGRIGLVVRPTVSHRHYIVVIIIRPYQCHNIVKAVIIDCYYEYINTKCPWQHDCCLIPILYNQSWTYSQDLYHSSHSKLTYKLQQTLLFKWRLAFANIHGGPKNWHPLLWNKYENRSIFDEIKAYKKPYKTKGVSVFWTTVHTCKG